MPEPSLSVLFVCTGNSARSQMAEAILRHLAHGAVEVASAGTLPKPEIHPMARRAVETLLGLDMIDQYPKSLDQFLHRDFDYVMTVCDRAAETCPIFPGDPERIHWSLEDPAAVTGTDEQRQRAFNNVAQQLLGRMRVWLSLPALRNRIESHRTKGVV
jgi:protein-tyrosine-phosphatase